MDNYITCGVCSKVYKSSKTYNQHIDLKRCKLEIETIVIISCQYCSKVFTRNFNKTKHEDKCDKNPKCIIEQLKLQIKKYEDSPNVVNNGTINITNNTQNIIINNLGNEDISHITQKQMIRLLRMNKECPVEMIKMIHFNANKPENHNVYKPNFKDKYVKYCDNNIWKIGDLMKIVTELYLSKMDIAEEKFDELKQFLEDSKKDRFQQLLDNREEPEIMGGILKRIIEILYNEKSVITDKLK